MKKRLVVHFLIFIVVAFLAITIERAWLSADGPRYTTEIVNTPEGIKPRSREVGHERKVIADIVTVSVVVLAGWLLLRNAKPKPRNS